MTIQLHANDAERTGRDTGRSELVFCFSDAHKYCLSLYSMIADRQTFPPPNLHQFVEEGTFQKQADMTRLRTKYGHAEARAIAHRERREQEDANAVPLGDEDTSRVDASRKATLLPALPDEGTCEWWDCDLLTNKSYDKDILTNKRPNINLTAITIYVEHPVPLDPPVGGESVVPAPRPLMLTKQEQKKLRTQRRLAREMEKQEMIKQGLLEPPKPKVKISNLMRVLTESAVQDPTAIEKEVREQMAERAEAHEDRNLARQLTPAERKEKKLRKMFDDASGNTETHVRVYRIESLKNPKHKFRVDINAQENHLTGTFDYYHLLNSFGPVFYFGFLYRFIPLWPVKTSRNYY